MILYQENENIEFFGKMTIEGTFYRITPVNDHSAFYDLELLYEIGGKNPRKEFKVVAYGLRLNNAINAIIRYGINNKYKDEVITFKQYVEEFNKQKQDLESQFREYSR